MAVAVGVTASGILAPFLTAALAVQMEQDLSIDVSAIGALFGLFFGVSALSSAPLGKLVQRRGWPTAVRFAAAGSALTLLGMATIARDLWTVGGLFVLGGVSASASQPAANLALARSVPRQRQGLLFGLKHVAVPAAAMLGGLAVPGLALTVGWRWAYVAGAGLAVLVAVSAPRASPRPGVATTAEPEQMKPRTPLSTLVVLAATTGLGVGAMDALAAFAVAYGVEAGLAEGSAGLLLSAASIAALSTRLLSGWLIDRRPAAGLRGITSLLLAGTVGMVALAAGGRTWLIAGMLLAFGAGWGWSGLMTFTVVWSNPEAPAAATGVTHTGTFAGAAAGPPLVGLLIAATSYAVGWWVVAGALLVAAAMAASVRLEPSGPDGTDE